MVSEVELVDIGYGAFLGLLWGVYGFLSNRRDNPDESLDEVKLGTTLMVFAIAGAVISMRGDPVSYDEVDALVIILAPIGDSLLNQWLGIDGAQRGAVDDARETTRQPPPHSSMDLDDDEEMSSGLEDIDEAGDTEAGHVPDPYPDDVDAGRRHVLNLWAPHRDRESEREHEHEKETETDSAEDTDEGENEKEKIITDGP